MHFICNQSVIVNLNHKKKLGLGGGGGYRNVYFSRDALNCNVNVTKTYIFQINAVLLNFLFIKET